MIYVALQRARRTVVGSALVLALITVVVVVSFLSNNVHIKTDAHQDPHSILAAVALLAALVTASITATSLSRESPTLPIVWTKPVSRQRIALEYFAVDFGTIAAVALLALLAAVVCALPTGALREFAGGPRLAEAVARTLGIVFMWYAVVQAATAGLAGRAGIVAGMSWPLFSGLTALAVLNVPGLHGLALLINVFNPLAWTTSSSHAAGSAAAATSASLYPFLPEPVVLAAPWLLGALALYLAILLWSRREA